LQIMTESKIVAATPHDVQLALQAGGIGTWEWDFTTGRMHWSGQLVRMIGRSPDGEEPSLDHLLAAMHPDDRRHAAAQMAEFRSRLGPLRIETRFLWPGGETHWLVFLGETLAGADGAPARMLGIVIDSTRRLRGEEAVRETAERLRLAMHAGGLADWEYDFARNTGWWSAEAAAMHGLPPERTAIPLEEWMRLIHPESRRAARRAFRSTLISLGDYSIEYRVIGADGVERWIAIHGSMLRLPGGAPNRIVGVMADITARKQAEIALRDSEQRLTLATEAAGIGIWDWNLLDNSMQYSEQAKAICEFPRGEPVTYEMARAVTHPGDLPHTTRLVQRAIDPALRDTPTFEYRLLLPGGRTRWVAAFGRAVFAEVSGAIRAVRYIGTLQDITARKQADHALAENEGRLRELLATIDLATVFVRDWDGSIRFWSRGCERLYGFSTNEAVGRSANDLLKTVFPVPLPEIEAALLQRGEWDGDVRQQCRDGHELLISMRKVLRRDAEGRPAAVLESVADVTRLREVEAQLRSLNEELEARVRAEVAAREIAQARAAHGERLQALGQLAGGIAHDFNNVLQSIQGGAALIGKRPHDAAAVQRFARMILDASGRGASVTRRLLAFARRGDLRAEPIDAAELLHGMAEVLGAALGAGVRITVKAEPGLSLLADKSQLETALVNLATNARDAMPDGGMLTMTAETDMVRTHAPFHPDALKPGHYIRIEVADTGQGMDAAMLPRVLEPFFTTKPVGRGTGLGLPMVKGFVEQSGGGLNIDSRPGLGTTITLWLPSAASAAAPPTGADASRRAHAGTARMLLVEDEALVREVLAMQLEELGYAVLVASNAEEALALLTAGEDLQALVTDLSMPGMDGLALIQAAQAQRPGLPAVLLTGYAGDGTALALSGAISGSFSLLRKPVTGEQLADRVAALLQVQS
jgi:PAS domain S-box-containing protein